MKTNRSPWIHQLHNRRTVQKLDHDYTAGIAVIGAGIAGVSTAFQILHETDQSVVIIEAKKLAHGATGHNAGQLTNYFEKPYADIVAEFGVQLAAEAATSIEEDAWGILRSMYARAGCTSRISEFMGYDGLPSRAHIDRALETNRLRKQGDIEPHPLWISDVEYYDALSPDDKKLATLVAPDRIQTALETTRTDFIGCLVLHKGCGNSAKLSEEIVEYLERAFPDRFAIFEHTPVHKVVLHDDHVLLDTGSYTVTAERVVLCTNGFEHFDILSTRSGLAIDTSFHYNVAGQTGTMAAYLDRPGMEPTAVSYYEGTPKSFDDNEEYFYMTRRHYDLDAATTASLVCVGGPVTYLPEVAIYDRDNPVNEVHHESIDDFIRRTYRPAGDLEYYFTWHGLMGYTRNGIRMVGADPRDAKLVYNLGCNGVGLLPSIFGAYRIARILAGDVPPPSIFDIKI